MSPAPLRFALRIDLGNEAMQTGSDVARSLREIADLLEGHASWQIASVGPERNICDANGNTVGAFRFEERSFF